MTTRTISTVIATCNRSAKLRRAIESLLACSIPPGWSHQIVVSDNCSSDDTADVVAALSNGGGRISYVHEPRRGKSFALNTGIRAATGHIIAFIDDDILVSPDWIRAIVSKFESYPDLAVLGGRVELYNDNDINATTRTSREQRDLKLADISAQFVPILGCNMVFRREVFEEIGLFDTLMGPGTRLPAAEDLDIMLRACSADNKVTYTPDVCVYHDHGRSDEAAIERLRSAYSLSRGGYYAKYLWRWNRQVSRECYWEIRALFLDVLRSPIAGTTAEQRQRLRNLLKGMIRYCGGRLRRKGGEEPLANGTDPSSKKSNVDPVFREEH